MRAGQFNHNEELQELAERLAIYEEKLDLIPSEKRVREPFLDFFETEASFLSYVLKLYKTLRIEKINKISLETLKKRNENLYAPLLPQNYSVCFGNPDYAVKMLGKEYGAYFCAIYAELRGTIVYAYENRAWDLCVCIELFLESYCVFAYENIPKAEILKNIITSYNNDYCRRFTVDRISMMVDPENDFALRIIMDYDLNDLRYLYAFGEYISENEVKTAEFLNSLPETEIDVMARTFTEGYRIGFKTTGKDIKKKKTVNIRYSIGFERIVKRAVLLFEEMGLKPIIYRTASHCVNKKRVRVGYFGSDPNAQFGFDHIGDESLFLDESFVTKRLFAFREAFEKNKCLSAVYAGPVCVDVFGEKPFIPEVKKNALSISKEQSALKVEYESKAAQITNRYIIPEESSYTIIAYPVPQIGGNYEDIFRETVKINTLDYKTYQKTQQCIIDALDAGNHVVVRGKGKNETDITIRLHGLSNPQAETNFENCLADVNIPLGEVFTSPLLSGTNGLLHVSEVYIEGLCFKDLRIRVREGMIEDYSCGNFDNEEDGRKYIDENILFHHKTLPVGEFAIGTNTTAYAFAKHFGIFKKLPILIAEKTGPHIAFGDTCYRHEEDMVTYNPDGKQIIARENEISALRKSDISKAYFNCHTDITIPYDELECIYAVTKNGEKIYIINNGEFVLEGTRQLNTPLKAT